MCPRSPGRSGGSHEAVVDGETGFVVAPRDVAAVRAAIARLVADDELRARMGAAARRRAVDEFAYDRLGDDARAGRARRPLGRRAARPVASA